MRFVNDSVNSYDWEIDSPFKLKICRGFVFVGFIAWCFFILFWILTIGIGVIAPIATLFENGFYFEEDAHPYYLLLFSFLWIGMMIFLFYGVYWSVIGVNYPQEIVVSNENAEIIYSITMFNRKIPKSRLQMSQIKFYGIPFLKVKDQKKILGIRLNKLMYEYEKIKSPKG